MSAQHDSDTFDNIRRLLEIQMQAVMKALDDALERQRVDEREKLLTRLGRAMSRHVYAWEQAIKTDSLEDLADALENALE